MRDETSEFGLLAARFTKLGAADRRAVLANFSASERAAFERELAEERRAQRGEKENARLADRQFVGYSPWLAAIVESTLSEVQPEDRCCTDACAKAITLAHQTTGEQRDDPPAFFRFLRDLGLPALAPKGTGRS